MRWSDFYDAFYDWSDSTRRTRISSLEDIGSGEEVVAAMMEIDDEKVRAQLIRKAMRLGVSFTTDDFIDLYGEISDELYEQVGEYTGLDPNDPWFDEGHMTWEDFYDAYFLWEEPVLLRRIQKLTQFGPHEEVCDAITSMPTLELETLLYQKARRAGVRFTRDELAPLGDWDAVIRDFTENELSDENIRRIESDANTILRDLDRPRQEVRVAPVFIDVKKKRKDGRCDGDCANCPPHYGYRYGRWYYGHGHQRGCQRGGNGGATGKTYRD